MSKPAEPYLNNWPLLNNTFSRRDFVRSGALVAGAMADMRIVSALFEGRHSTDETSPIRMGLASYTFRNFNPRLSRLPSSVDLRPTSARLRH